MYNSERPPGHSSQDWTLYSSNVSRAYRTNPQDFREHMAEQVCSFVTRTALCHQRGKKLVCHRVPVNNSYCN